MAHEVFESDGQGLQRIPTKTYLKLLASRQPAALRLRDTSIVSNGFTGSMMRAPDGRYDVSGPHANQAIWYATIDKKGTQITVL